jgi:hypothetical protein
VIINAAQDFVSGRFLPVALQGVPNLRLNFLKSRARPFTAFSLHASPISVDPWFNSPLPPVQLVLINYSQVHLT